MTSIPGESNGRKSAPKSTAVFVAPNTETEGLPGEREHPLVIPNQRSVHRNDEDYRRDVCDDDVGGSDDVNDKAATMPGRKTTREDRGSTPVTSHKAAHDVCSLYRRVCTNAKAGRRTREIDFKQIIGYSVQGRLRDYVLHRCMSLACISLYVYTFAYTRTLIHVYIHVRDTYLYVKEGGVVGERVAAEKVGGRREVSGFGTGRKRWRKKKK